MGFPGGSDGKESTCNAGDLCSVLGWEDLFINVNSQEINEYINKWMDKGNVACVCVCVCVCVYIYILVKFYMYQFSSVVQLCSTLCDTLHCSTPGFPAYHRLPEFAQTLVIESVMPSNCLILCHPFSSCLQSFPALGSFHVILFSLRKKKKPDHLWQH